MAQGYRLEVKLVDTNQQLLPNLQLKTGFANQAQCQLYVQQLPVVLQTKGYLAASVDSATFAATQASVVLYVGEKYVWKHITVANEAITLLNQLGFEAQQLNTQPFNWAQLTHLYEQLLDYFENNGYPFAQIRFDSVQLQQKSISAKLVINKGVLYKLDSLRIVGNANISSEFLYRYLELSLNAPFSNEKLARINQRLLELPYVQQSKNWDITMLSNSYILNLYLQPKRSNQVNVLIGLLPANNQVGGALLLTGEANLNLKNAFATGETIALNWQQLQSSSPRLNFGFQKPYIFSTPLGVDVGFELYKKDSAYLNIRSKIGLQYEINTKTSCKVWFENFTTHVLTVDTFSIITTKKLPDIADVSNTSLAVEYTFNNTNYKFNPRKGNEVYVYLAAGNKSITKNNTILQLKDAGFNYSQLYDSVKLQTYQLKFRGNYANYFAVGKQAVIKTTLNMGWIESANYFRNELFQIGGYKLLRGFDEESIFTSGFAVATVEYRYLLGINSYMNAFTDLGFTKNNATQQQNSFVGAGIGLAFETKQGIFNISYAVGKRNDVPFDMRQSKIHMGFVSFF